MKIGIMGAGAVGCGLGGALLAAGWPVVMVGRAGLRQEVREHGLTLTDGTGRSVRLPPDRIDYSTEPSALTQADAVLVTVKSGDTEKAARAMEPHLRSSAVVISFQNGVRNPGRLQAILRRQKVLAGMVPFNILRGPRATFHRGTSGSLAIERANGRELRVAQALARAGFAVLRHKDMTGVLWGKLIVNLNNAVNALCGLPIRQELGDRRYRRVLAASMAEGLGALRAAGIRPRRVGRLIPSLAPRVLPLPDGIFFRLAGAMVKIDSQARSSMWEDLQRGRPTEIDDLNGEIVRLGEAFGVPTPVNSGIAALIRAAETAGRGSPGLGPLDLARAVGTA